MAGAHFGKLFASSGTSALLRQYVRSRNIKLSFQTSPYSNCPSCRIREADLLAPRSRVCAYFEVLIRLFPDPSRESPFFKTTCRQRLLAPGRLFVLLRSSGRKISTWKPLVPLVT